MTPKLFITLGALFGLLLGIVLGFGTDWLHLITYSLTGGIIGFAVLPIKYFSSAKKARKDDDA